ncbi:unnamed protein product [Closterium sp. Yama58-4]|nr:unnamed protein product [Closterium sp. Yama58-4]
MFSGRLFIPFYTWLPIQENREIQRAAERVRRLSLDLIATRRQQQASEPGRDLLAVMLAARDDVSNEQMTDQQLVDECITFLVAGHETTAKLLTWGVYLLARFPEWQQRLREEVWQVMGEHGDAGKRTKEGGEEGEKEEGARGKKGGGGVEVAWEQVAQLRQMHMVLLETLRLFPPTPTITREASKDVALGPYSIPAGTRIMMSLAMPHSDPRYWGEDVLEFNPARFKVPTDGIQGACSHPQAFVPFSAGPRDCIGSNFALTEAKVVLAHLLRRLEWDLSPTYVHLPSVGITLTPKYGMPLRMRFGPYDAPFSVFFPPGSPFRFLKRLQLSYCFDEERLPSNIGQVLPRLQELSINECEALSDLTDAITSLTCLESLTVCHCRVYDLPEDFGHLPALKTLVLSHLLLRTLPASFTRLASLETFFLHWCEDMEELPAGFGRLTALRSLSLAGSSILQLPEDLGGLTNLHTFYFEKNSLGQLLSPLAQLASLTRLELQGVNSELPDSMGEMTNLQELYIHHCYSCMELPEAVTSLGSLRVLRITECKDLLSVPRRLDGLTSLTLLELRGCWRLYEVPQVLPLSLQALWLSENQQLGSLPDISRLTGLRELCLHMVDAACIEAIGEHLSNVQHLELGLTAGAEESLSALTRLPRLRTLSVSTMRDAGLTELPAAITTLHHLTSITIDVENLSSLPHNLGVFSRLRKLDLSGCSSLVHLPASLTQLSRLQELSVSCTSIRLLPPGFAQLSRLRRLHLSYCKQLEALPDDLTELRMLEHVSTSGCDMLQQ